MTVDEIKWNFPVPDIVRQEGIEISRSGFCRCIYHQERTASMKLYEHSWYCFGCGRSGDVVDIIRQIYNMTFQDACVYLTGEKAGYKTRQRVALAKMRRKAAEREKEQKRTRLLVANEMISFYRRVMLLFEPTDPDAPIDDRYAEAIHGYTKYVGIQEELLWELEHEKNRNRNHGQGDPVR